MHEAKQANASEVTVWGTGTPRREFLYVDDMAAASVAVMHLPYELYVTHTTSTLSHINVGTGTDVSINELARLIAKTVGYTGTIRFDPKFPDGAPRKLLNVAKLTGFGVRMNIRLDDGLQLAYQDFLSGVAARDCNTLA